MAASNIADLFDFETHYENALANYFSSLNAAPFNQVLTPRATGETLETPRLAVSFSVTGTGAQEALIPNSATYFRPHRSASLTLTLASQRAAADQPHGVLRGRVRQGMLEVTAALNDNTLPYYQTLFVTETGSVQSIDSDNDEIITQLTYAIEFAIKASEWPA